MQSCYDVCCRLRRMVILCCESGDLYVYGSVQEAASLQQKRGNLQHYGATFDMLLSDILDHYRTFGMLERYLKNPSSIADQLELQIPSHTQTLLIEKYAASAFHVSLHRVLSEKNSYIFFLSYVTTAL